MGYAFALVVVAVTACTDVGQGIDYVTAPAGLELGHRWDCKFEIQYGFPAVSVEEQEFKPCLPYGTAARDAFIDGWVHDTCWPKIDIANAAGLAPGGGDCGGDGCDPQNWDLCDANAD